MKKNFIAAAVFLFATVGAFATAKNTTLSLVWYNNSDGVCIQALATPCTQTGAVDCVEPLSDPSTTLPLGISAQIYAQRDGSTLQCITPYDRP